MAKIQMDHSSEIPVRPQDKKVLVRKSDLARSSSRGLDDVRIGPGINVIQAERQRNKQQRPHGQRDHQIFHDAAHGHAPGRAAQELHLHEKESSQADGAGEGERHQIGAEETVGILDVARDARHDGDQGGQHQRVAARRPARRFHLVASGFGTSPV